MARKMTNEKTKILIERWGFLIRPSAFHASLSLLCDDVHPLGHRFVLGAVTPKWEDFEVFHYNQEAFRGWASKMEDALSRAVECTFMEGTHVWLVWSGFLFHHPIRQASKIFWTLEENKSESVLGQGNSHSRQIQGFQYVDRLGFLC